MRYGRDVFSGRRGHAGRWIALAVAVAMAALAVFAIYDNGRVVLRTQRVLVPDLPESLEGFTILHVSDLNGKRFGPKQKQVEQALRNKKYSAVCVTGDMVGKRGDYYPFYEFLSALDTTKPVYFIAGDSDPAPVGSQGIGSYAVLADWILNAQTRGAVYLDAPAYLTVGKSKVWFLSAAQYALDLDTAAAAYANSGTPEGAYYADVIARTRTAQGQMSAGDLHIALSHMPLRSETVQALHVNTGSEGGFVRSADLVLAGGMAGGQWRLPLIGPVWGDGWFPDDSLVEGYHYTGNNRVLQYVSAGLGTSGTCPLPDFRLFNTPEMTLITFTSVMDFDVLPQS